MFPSHFPSLFLPLSLSRPLPSLWPFLCTSLPLFSPLSSLSSLFFPSSHSSLLYSLVSCPQCLYCVPSSAHLPMPQERAASALHLKTFTTTQGAREEFPGLSGQQETTDALNVALEARIRGSRRRVEERERDVMHVKEELGAVKEELGAVTEELGTVKEELGAVKEELGAVREELGAVEEELVAVKEELGAVKAEMGVVKEELGAVKEELGAVKTELGAVPSLSAPSASFSFPNHPSGGGVVIRSHYPFSSLSSFVHSLFDDTSISRRAFTGCECLSVVSLVVFFAHSVYFSTPSVRGALVLPCAAPTCGERQLEETRRGLEEAERRRAEELILVNREVLTVRGELVAVKGELVTVRGELATARGELAPVKGELEIMKGEVVTLRRELATAKGELAPVKGLLEIMKDQLVTLRGELVTTRGELVTAKGGLMEPKREVAFQDSLQKVEKGKSAFEVEVKKLRKGVGSNEAAALQCTAPKHPDPTLDLKGSSGLSDTFLRHVSSMTHLKHVRIDASAGFTSQGIKCLYTLPQLECLELKGALVTNSTLDGIGRVRSLKFLFLNRTHVTDSGLPHLTCLTSLKTLIFYKCKRVTCAGIVHVGRMTSLEELYLYGSGVKDKGLGFLAPLTRLRMLILPDTTTDAGLESIQYLSALEWLNFTNSEATEKGVKLLGRLPRLKQIRSFDFSFQTLLRTSLPGVKVSSDLLPGAIYGD
ncbi:unnamed protein product [Closterium sp. Yama58-4]|nr:unnamed protein product [Closterium sp. Yama58-4]